MAARKLRVVLVGTTGKPLHTLLLELLVEMSVDVVPADAGAPDVVVAFVEPGNVGTRLFGAQVVGGAAPILAIIPFEDAQFACRVLARGAQACYPLTRPLDEFRFGAGIPGQGKPPVRG